jgi:hypothetical protein
MDIRCPPHTLQIFSECFMCLLGCLPGNFGSHPCSWHLEQQNSLKTRLAPFSYKQTWGKRREEPHSFTTCISSIFKQMMLIYETFKHNLLFLFSFLWWQDCASCKRNICYWNNLKSKLCIDYNEQPGTSSYSKLLATRCGWPVKMNSWMSTELTMHWVHYLIWKASRTAAKTRWECYRIGLTLVWEVWVPDSAAESHHRESWEKYPNKSSNHRPKCAFCNSYNPKLEHFNKIKDLSPPKLN